jgi:RimJ/RimL family protein N-acetyltransferase
MIEEYLIRDGYRPAIIAEVMTLEMAYFTANWGFGRQFEAKLAADMGEFFARYDDSNDLFLGAFDCYDRLIGSITVDGINAAQHGAQLRWFVVNPSVQGRGVGQALMERIDVFLREHGYQRTFLTTFEGLEAARRLYERFGFRLVAEDPTDPWSGNVGMQTFVRETP